MTSTTPMRFVLRQLFALCSMGAGASLVFSLMYFMNLAAPPPKQEQATLPAEFQVDKPPPKRDPQRTERKRPTPTRTTSRPAATPSVTAALAGPSFALAQFEVANMASAAEQALAASSSTDQVFTASSVDEKPKPLQRVAPEVPKQAARGGITGFVKVRFLIDASGTVERPQVVEAQPEGMFENGVLAALSRWTYEPARYHGAPVKVSVTQTFRFD